MNIRISLLLPSLAFATLILAQDVPDSLNMIENGSFEQIEGKLKRLGSLEMAKGWKSPTAKKADLFSETVASSPASAPRSERGDQSALSGQNYAGLLWWSYMNKEPRTYMQAKFKKTLKKGQKYCVRYYVTLGDLSKYGADQFGAYLSKMLIKKDDESNLTYEPQIPALRTKIYDDLYSWQGVCGMYEAKGDEANTVKIKRPKGETRPQAASAYYFIDDVAVFPIKSPSECKCEQLDKAESEFIYGKKTTTNKALKPDAQLDQSVIYFKRFQQTVDGSMDPLMNELTELLKANPDLKIRLIGHTDAIEAERVRMRPDLTELARERADAVKAAFVEGGIDAARIITADQKAESPADPNEGEVALSKNRRVEFELEK
jgi:outer membrane protein OmpA-like peptidoglycan-associated protein